MRDGGDVNWKWVAGEFAKTLLCIGILWWFLMAIFLLPGCAGIQLPEIPMPSCPEGQAGHWEHGTEWVCEPIPVPTPEPPVVVEPTPEPTPVPTPTPTPQPTPEPTPPPSGFSWEPSTDADLCVQAVVEARADLGLPASSAAPPEYLADVEAMTLEEPPREGDTEEGWYSRLVPLCEIRGLHCALYGEELAVARSKSMSENYDRLLTSGKPRSGIGTFRSRCFPATASKLLIAPPPGLPAPRYPAKVSIIRVKVHTPAVHRPDGMTLMDGVALARGVNPDFPGRPTWPACGPEGETEEEVLRRTACDHGLNPRWDGRGRNHNQNPWLYHAAVGTLVQVCINEICSTWEEAK